MKKISKDLVDVSNLNAYAYLQPHPLVPDSYADIETEWFSWIPGFDSRDLGDEDEEPLLRDNNIQLYNKIEEIAVERFNAALKNVWPLLDSLLINNLSITIDVTGDISGSSSLAAYVFADSNPQKGNYYFNLAPSYLHKLLVTSNNGEELDLKYHTTWEHEIIHLIDHRSIEKSSVFRHSNLAIDCLRCYIVNYRDEGIPELYYLLKGGSPEIKNVQMALEKFKVCLDTAKQKCSSSLEMTHKEKEEVLKTYDFYELGPWIVLDMLKKLEGGYHEEFITSVIEQVEAGKVIDHEVILQVLEIALRIKPDEFINIYIN